MWDTSMSLWFNSLNFYIKIYLLGDGWNFNTFSCSIFPYYQWGPKWEPKIGASRSHNLSYCIPIYKWDTSLNLRLNSLMIYIKIYLLGDGWNFSPFPCSIFTYFQCGPKWESKIWASRSHNLSYCIPIYKWDTSLNLWLNSLTIYIKIYLLGDGWN